MSAIYCIQFTTSLSQLPVAGPTTPGRIPCLRFTVHSSRLVVHPGSVSLNCPWFTTDSLRLSLVFTGSRGRISRLRSMSGSGVESLRAFVITFSRPDDLYEAYQVVDLRNIPELADIHQKLMRRRASWDPRDDSRMIVRCNLTSENETSLFAVHLVDVLVDTFGPTSDIKYQGCLSCIIQELSRFCGFTSALVRGAQSVE